MQAEVLMYLYVFSILNDFLNLARGYTNLIKTFSKIPPRLRRPPPSPSAAGGARR